MNKFLNIAKRIPFTTVEGPGLRYAIWTQGCNVGCDDCCNQEMLPFVPKEIISVETLIDDIKKAINVHHIEGITLLGGEPTLQADALSEIAEACQKLGINVMLFSGIRYERLLSLDRKGVRELLENVDVLVDGPFLPQRTEKLRNWAGSTNQRFHFFTSVYDSSIETDSAYRPAIEFHISLDKKVKIVGNATLFGVN